MSGRGDEAQAAEEGVGAQRCCVLRWSPPAATVHCGHVDGPQGNWVPGTAVLPGGKWSVVSMLLVWTLSQTQHGVRVRACVHICHPSADQDRGGLR